MPGIRRSDYPFSNFILCNFKIKFVRNLAKKFRRQQCVFQQCCTTRVPIWLSAKRSFVCARFCCWERISSRPFWESTISFVPEHFHTPLRSSFYKQVNWINQLSPKEIQSWSCYNKTYHRVELFRIKIEIERNYSNKSNFCAGHSNSYTTFLFGVQIKSEITIY